MLPPVTPPSVFLAKDSASNELKHVSIIVSHADRIEEKEDGFCLVISDTWGWQYLIKEKFQVLHTLRFGFSFGNHPAKQN